ncbi:PQQ-dependent sugar dehydrogenase [Croceitalea vernalis]|uniref:PQQ-dependent sugar dehydrogenase n=1 Tax=Croceitalea vernalis TaxID=3075599 RepID=A0ABU3BKK9_9FLAO|nr:PQQ-dependent sugar dehydrogenase [Croceitalea sp. P007]MDT0622659.1 PQQ-dependent sugar dehydrogenase [Croceitalea sp. P007]
MRPKNIVNGTRFLYLSLLLSFSSLFGQISYEKVFTDVDFDLPIELLNANDGTDRLFIVEQLGKVRVIPNDQSIVGSDVDVFLDISSKINISVGQEVGLLGMAFHPDYTSNGYVYVYYTDFINGLVNMNLARFTVDSNNPNQVDPSSELELFQYIKNLDQGNHNGGKIAFGPDGYLYVSIGDGGGGGDPAGNGQDLNTVFGSILRIDVDLNGDNPVESNPEEPNGRYEIPSDNPRVGLSGLDELYVWGIRNTWKFSFDNVNNIMWGADVGQGRREEINIITKGANYGWGKYEGLTTYDNNVSLITSPDTKPILEYDHSDNDKSITGGYVYRGPINNSSISNKYIYGDYISGRVWALDYDSTTGNATTEFLFRTNGQKVASFGLDEAQNIYFLDYGYDVHIYKITGDSSGPTTTAVDGIGDWLKTGFEGTNGIVQTIHNDGSDNYYVGGDFSSVENISANNIAYYSVENGWNSLGNGTNGTVNAIISDSQGNVYIGGSFSEVNGVTASNIAVWNGSIWSALKGGTSGTVAKLGLDSQDNLFVGGVFINVDNSITANNIAKWDGSNWSNLIDSSTSTIGTNNEIRSIAFDENDNLIVGGNFSTAGGKTALRIATWDGNFWGTLGNGTSGFVESIYVTPNYIYAGGNFSIAGNINANRIARWNRNNENWEALGNGLSGNVSALAYDGTYIYAGGSFETASDIEDVNKIMNNIARWSSSNGWQALGPNKTVGVSTGINSLAFNTNSSILLAGGNFNNAGNISFDNIAAWQESNSCSNGFVTPEILVNGNLTNATSLDLTEGDILSISIEQDFDFQIRLPNGSFNQGILNISSAGESDTGTYSIMTTQGCTLSLIINVTAPEVCNAFSITPEYDINGVINSGSNELTIEEGDSFVLRIVQSTGFTITKPDNVVVDGELNFGVVNTSQGGIYTFTTENGCIEDFNLIINPPAGCDKFSITPEYVINGETSSGLNEITLEVGTSFVLGIRQSTTFTTTLPDNSIVNGSYDFGLLEISDSGTYTFETLAGCVEEFLLNVTNSSTCTAESITPEYSVNGTTSNGLNEIEVNEGDEFILGILQSNTFTITLLDSSVVSGPYDFGALTIDEDGIYNITTDEGCEETFTLNVLPSITCTSASITPEYTINGATSFGLNQITLDEGTTFELGILQNNNFEITLLDNSIISGVYDFGTLTTSDSGNYQITDENNCIENFELIVLPVETCDQFSITPKYLINEEEFIGENELTLIEGTAFQLGIRQSNTFTIQFPDNSIENGPYDFGILRVTNQGTYTFTTDEGCTEDFVLIILPDSDFDGITDADDLCANTPDGQALDENGCAESQLDDDNDGVSNLDDICDNTPFGESVNSTGCSSSQLDSDSDGVVDMNDICPNTPTSESTDLNGCSESQLDDDNDGVFNNTDLCPNTEPGITVDSDGCEILPDDDNDGVPNIDDLCPNTLPNSLVDTDGCVTVLPNDNFTISTTSTTCRGVFDGELLINSNLVNEYTASLTSTSFAVTRNFNESVLINELPADTYELCLTAEDLENYEVCFTVVIEAPQPLSVFSIINQEEQSVTLQMAGSEQFVISLNSKSFTTTANEITLDLPEKINELKVSTGQECQGVFEENIVISNDAWLYPNPFNNSILLNTSRINETSISYIIYSISGKQLIENTVDIENKNEIELQFENLPSGVFILKLTLKDSQQIFKLVKR